MALILLVLYVLTLMRMYQNVQTPLQITIHFYPCVLLNCLLLFFIHLKLQLLRQFPSSNDENNITIYKNMHFNLKQNYDRAFLTSYFINFNGILI